MMQRLWFLAIVCCVISVPVAVFAVGGGSGGGSGPDAGSSNPYGTSCAGICDLVCTGNGAISFRSTYVDMLVEAKRSPSGPLFIVKGYWLDTKFTSEEAIFNEPGDYEVNGYQVRCPGLVFSCRVINVTVQSCTQNAQGIQAYYRAVSTASDVTRFVFRTASGGTIFHEQTLRSGKLNAIITEEDFRKRVVATYFEPITAIEVSDTRCTGRYVRAASAPCVPAAPINVTAPYKCADLFLISDRIKCRLSLTPQEQEDELKLVYLPEQCRALNGSAHDRCIENYQALRVCHKYQTTTERVTCARQVIGLRGTLAQQCGLAPNRTLCQEEFKDMTFRLIYFRLYELEEKAERWLEDDRISLQQATDFITLVEQAKINFMHADTYDARRTILFGVRDLWNEFVRDVR